MPLHWLGSIPGVCFVEMVELHEMKLAVLLWFVRASKRFFFLVACDRILD